MEITIEFDHSVASAVRAIAGSESSTCRIGLPDRNALGPGAGNRADAELFRSLTPVGARLEPGEIDPLAVGAPVDVAGLSAVQLRPAHDVLDGEVEGLGGLATEWRGYQYKE